MAAGCLACSFSSTEDEEGPKASRTEWFSPGSENGWAERLPGPLPAWKALLPWARRPPTSLAEEEQQWGGGGHGGAQMASDPVL